MKILALDSATSQCSIALCADARRIVEGRRLEGGSQGDRIPTAIEEMLRDAALAIGDLDRLAVTIGPGRFTGLRAGLAFMRGLSLASGIPLIGVTTLDALLPSNACGDDEVALAVIDSKRAELFFQLFDARGAAIGAAFAMRPEHVADRLAGHRHIVVVGEHAQMVADALASEAREVRAVERCVDAVDVAAVAADRVPTAGAPAPLYIHPPATTTPASRGAP